MCHLIGSLLPLPGNAPKFSQIYLMAPETQLAQRQNIYDNRLNNEVYALIFNYLNTSNNLVSLYKAFGQNPLLGTNEYKVIIKPPTACIDKRRYNLPTQNEIAIIMPADYVGEPRDIIIETRNNDTVRRISELHPLYDPLAYPLLFFNGEPGWYPEMKQVAEREIFEDEEENDDDLIYTDKKVTVMDYAIYRLQIRKTEDTHLFQSKNLFHQWIVDNFAKMEQGRLNFLRFNQTKLRAELYQGLNDAVNNGDQNLNNVGKLIVLPSSYIGSPRAMAQLYQDAMALVRTFGKPDLFITITCNPSWPEIKRELLEGQQASDRPDLVSRIFSIKLQDILDDINKSHILGEVQAYCYSIEFQKRGLPHCHLLVILKPSDKPRSANDFDRFVSAELPDPVTQPELYKTVTRCMLHEPCSPALGSRCMNDKGKCSKDFPKAFCEATTSDENSFPTYQRRDRGYIEHNNKRYTNQHVIPYNPYLAQKYNCHINVEICCTVKSVKYIYKYIFKGNDAAMFDLESPINVDEIKNYQDSRYVSAHEAAWRLIGLKMSKMSHSVQTLNIHLENQHYVVFDADMDPMEVDNLQDKSQLIQFFKFCARNPELCAEITYARVFEVASWDGKKFKPRQRGSKVIGRMFIVPANQGEKFYLRILLNHVQCPMSFADIRTTRVNGIEIIHATNKDACLALGLLEDDAEWITCINEASSFQKPKQLRQLLACLMVYANPINLRLIWDSFYEHFSEDYAHQNRPRDPLIPTNDALILALTLNDLRIILLQCGSNIEDFKDLPPFDATLLDVELEEQLIAEETSYDIGKMRATTNCLDQLNTAQRLLFDQVMHAVQNGLCKQYFVDGPGGTGKTFLYSMLLSHLRLEGKIVLAVASSGIAAILMDGGRTGHSRFKIPINIESNSSCHVKKGTALARLLKRTSLIIWDEVPMTHKQCYEAVDRMLKDIMDEPALPFGGITVLFGGDFRQLLPVIPRGSKGSIIQSSIKQSILWSEFEVHKLTVNMRVLRNTNDPNAAQFADFLIRVGDGTEPTVKVGEKHLIKLPKCMNLTRRTINGLIDSVYDDFHAQFDTPEYLYDRSILTPKNSYVDMLNELMIQMSPGESKVFLSADSVEAAEDVNPNLYPIELLNGINENGIPSHSLSFKIGTPVMILRNLNAAAGMNYIISI